MPGPQRRVCVLIVLDVCVTFSGRVKTRREGKQTNHTNAIGGSQPPGSMIRHFSCFFFGPASSLSFHSKQKQKKYKCSPITCLLARRFGSRNTGADVQKERPSDAHRFALSMRPLSHYFHALSFAPCLPIPCALLELTNHYYVYRNKGAAMVRLGAGVAGGAINSGGPPVSHTPNPTHHRTPQEGEKKKEKSKAGGSPMRVNTPSTV